MTGKNQPINAVGLNLSEITLPAELMSRLKAAAEIAAVTELGKCLNEVQAFGEAGQWLAEDLCDYLGKYDMEMILKVLSEIQTS